MKRREIDWESAEIMALTDRNDEFCAYLKSIDRPLDCWDYDDLGRWVESMGYFVKTL